MEEAQEEVRTELFFLARIQVRIEAADRLEEFATIRRRAGEECRVLIVGVGVLVLGTPDAVRAGRQQPV